MATKVRAIVSNASQRWQTFAADSLVWHGFEDSFVVFNHHTGNTHLLSPWGAALLQSLQDAPEALDTAELLNRLNPSHNESESDFSSDALLRALNEFEALGLIEMTST